MEHDTESDKRVDEEEKDSKVVLLNIVRDLVEDLTSSEEEDERRGEFLDMLQDFVEVLVDSEKDDAVELDTIRFMATFTLQALGNVDAALCILEEGVAMHDEDGNAFYALGDFYDNVLGKTKEAETLYRQCLELEPDHAPAANNLGASLILRAKGDEDIDRRKSILEEATRVLTAADRANPGYTSYNLACACALSGDAESCKEWLQHAKKFDSLPAAEGAKTDEDLSLVSGSEWFAALFV